MVKVETMHKIVTSQLLQTVHVENWYVIKNTSIQHPYEIKPFTSVSNCGIK